MSSTMESTAGKSILSTGFFSCFVMALALLLATPGAVHAAKETTIILTGNIERVFPVLNDDDKVWDAALRLEEEILKLRKDNPDAFLVDAGNHMSLSYAMETAYSLPIAEFFDLVKFDAVHLNTREATLTTDGEVGYHFSPPEYVERLFTSIRNTRPQPLGLPAAKYLQPDPATQPKAESVGLISLASLSAARGLAGKMGFLEAEPTERLGREIALAREEGSIAIAFSSMTPTEIAPILDRPDHRPQLLIDLLSDSSNPPALANGVWRVAAPRTGEIYLLKLTSDEGTLKNVNLTRVRYLTPEQVGLLIRHPISRIGMELPNLEAVAAQFFGLKNARSDAQRLPPGIFEDLTTETAPVTYHLTFEGKPIRLYRVMSQIPGYQTGFELDPNWPRMDMIVVLGEDSSFNRILTRVHFPIAGENTSTVEAINKLRGKDPSEWTPDPELTAGIVDFWNWATLEIRRVMELDRTAFGE